MAIKKNNIFKSLFSASIAAVSLMSAGFTTFADEVDNKCADLFETNAIESNFDVNLAGDEELVSLTAANASKILDVPFYNQKNDWYAGPATALQTYDYFYRLKYGTISPMTQDQMSANIHHSETYGTTVQCVLDYLNNCGFGCDYKQWWVWNDSVTYYTNQVCKSIDAGVPVIAFVKSSSTMPLGYTTRGHLLNITGYAAYGDKFQLTDPYYAGHGIATGKYYVTNTALENITDTISYYF